MEKLTPEIAYELYQKGMSQTEIAKQYEISKQGVSYQLKKHPRYKPRKKGDLIKQGLDLKRSNIPLCTICNEVKLASSESIKTQVCSKCRTSSVRRKKYQAKINP